MVDITQKGSLTWISSGECRTTGLHVDGHKNTAVLAGETRTGFMAVAAAAAADQDLRSACSCTSVASASSLVFRHPASRPETDRR